MSRISPRHLLAASVLLVSGACASGSGPAESTSSEPAPRARRNLITEAEIPEGATENAFEIIQRLRPEWLRPRTDTRSINSGVPMTILVFVDGQRFGAAADLRQIQGPLVAALRFYTPAETQAKFGMQYEAPSIEVTYKR